MTADQLLEEAIISLQKRGMGSQTTHLADEAAQLLASGREIEARALVEKAQAIAAPQCPAADEPIEEKQMAPAERTAQKIISRLSSRLAEDLTDALNEVVEELDRDFGAQINEVAAALEKRLVEITSQLQIRSDLQAGVERIERETAMATEQCQRLADSIGALQAGDQTRRTELERFSGNVSRELANIASRVAAQEDRLNRLSGLVQDVSSKTRLIEERIERHTIWVQSMQERQVKRAAALSAVLDGIAKLREAEPIASSAETGQAAE